MERETVCCVDRRGKSRRASWGTRTKEAAPDGGAQRSAWGWMWAARVAAAGSGAWSERHSAAADTRGVEKCVPDGGSYGHDGSFAGAGGGNVFAIKENGFDLRQVAKAWNAIRCEMRVLDAAVFELNRFEERAAEALNLGAYDLVAEAVGVDDGAAFKCRDQAYNLRLVCFRVARD